VTYSHTGILGCLNGASYIYAALRHMRDRWVELPSSTVSTLEKRCSGMANRCEDLMGKYKSVLRRMTQVEMSMGITRSRFETYPPQQFDLMDVLDTPITLGSHVVASGPRTLEERIELGRDWEQWLVSVEDVEEEERLVAEVKETAKVWVDSLVGDVDIAPK